MSNQYASKAKVDPEIEEDDSIDESSSTVDLNDYIQEYDNKLQKYENPTYHFKLYTYSAKDYKKYQFFDSNMSIKKTIIAESGVTGRYSIDDVEIHSISPGSRATKTGTALKFNMTLIEHRGMYFFDELMALSLNLGYNKIMDIPLILELSFIGFDKDNTTTPVVIPGCTKRWRVQINKAPGSLNSSGTTYNIEFTSKAYSVNQKDWRLGQAVEFIGSNTVETYVTAFQEAINTAMFTQYPHLTKLFPNDLSENNFFKFYVSPDIATLPLEHNLSQDTSIDKALNGKKGNRKFNFKSSDTIGAVIDALMHCVTSTDSTETNTIKQFVHVIPFQFYVGYDKTRGADVHRYEIYVIPYTVADVQDIYEIRNELSASKMVEKLQSIDPTLTKINMKRYDYTWSGRNTEILDLKLELNAQYAYASNRNIESLFRQENNDGIKKSEYVVKDQFLNSKNKSSLYEKNTSLLVTETNSQTEEAATLRGQKKSAAISGSTTTSEGDTEQASSTQIESDYLEDYEDLYDLTTYSTSDNNTGTAYLNIPIEYQNLPEVSSGSDVNNSNINEIKNRTITSNAYNDSFLLGLDITVLGDPYWLGDSEPSLLNKLRLYTGVAATSYTNEYQYVMDNIRAEPYLLLNLQSPSEINDNGLVEVSRNQLLSQTVYKAMSIVSKFSKGEFTQEISAHIVKRSMNRRK